MFGILFWVAAGVIGCVVIGLTLRFTDWLGLTSKPRH